MPNRGTRVDVPVPAPIADHLATSSLAVKIGSFLDASFCNRSKIDAVVADLRGCLHFQS